MNISHRLLKQKSIHLAVSAALSIAIGSSAVLADDIEAYRVEEIDPVGPNILFVLDESGSMNWFEGTSNRVAATNPGQRGYQLKEAMCAIIAAEKADNVNAGILGYRSSDIILTERFDFARVKDNRTALLQVIGNTTHNGPRCNAAFALYGVPDSGTDLAQSGGTPSSPALRYGMNWYRDSGRTPNENWCEPNYMVFVTDGDPNQNTRRTAFAGEACANHDTNYDWSGTDGSDTGARCSETITWWGYNHRPDDDSVWNNGDNDPELKKFRNVITHTIGLYSTAGTAREQYLINVAQESLDENHPTYNFSNDYGKTLPGYDSDEPYTGGRYVRSTNPDDLIQALNDFVEQATREINYTYTAPAIPFNPDNAAISGKYIYVPMFNPDSKTFWKGNLKKYKVGVDTNGDFFLHDAFNNDVVTSDLLFNPTQDLWGSGLTDDSLLGGAASHQAGTRNLLTRVGTDNTNLILVHKDTGGGTPTITADMLGDNVTTDAEREGILDWISWLGDGSTGFMGAALHTNPGVVRYSGSNDLVLLPTTEGILHAFNAGTTAGVGGGEEVWAFMPDEILPKLFDMRQNNDTQEPPVYGLDGPLTVYEYNSRKYAVVGMRRGGRNYYALDITDRENPAFAWEIIGGEASFTNLAQTWSKPILTTLRVNGTEQDVLVFGGGYDAATYDGAGDAGPSNRPTGGIGQTVYIVKPDDGTLLTSVTVSDISSVAADVLPVDINANNVTDRLYYADVGGRVMRIDIPDSSMKDGDGNVLSTSSGVIADINEGTGANAFRSFFNTPEIGYFSRGGVQYLAVLIGTGHRPKPLDMPTSTEADRFYMIKDYNVWLPPADGYTKIDHGTLVDATLGSTVTDGWYLDVIHGGETYKVFSKARLYDYAVLFTAYRGYTEGAESADPCIANAAKGKSAFFAVDMKDGAAIFADLGGDPDNLTDTDRSKNLKIPGIPPSPTLLFPEGEEAGTLGEDVRAIVGLEQVQKWPDRFHPVSWEECVGNDCEND